MKAIVAILSIFVTAPIWYFLLYKILQLVGATDVMWLLYWVYLPVCVMVQIIAKLADVGEAKK